MFNPVGYFFRFVANLLGDLEVIDPRRGERIADLTWPRFLTMFARRSQQVADAAMVGLSIGPAAIAGLAFAMTYWGIANAFALGLAGGTISQVSQRFGAEQIGELDLAVKQSVWIGQLVALPFTLAFIFLAESLIAILGADQATVTFGATYLRILAIAMLFNYFNTAASRTLAGADDTWIAMVVRATGAFVNIVFNAIFIFGLGMGVAGAALGTVIAEGLVSGCFLWGFLTGRLPVFGEFPVRLSHQRPYFDLTLSKQLVIISPPLVARKLARSVARIPLFAMLAVFGPTVVAAYEVSRRIQTLMSTPGSGFSMAGSSLVGQSLGKGDEPKATDFAWDLVRFSTVIYVVAAVVVVVFAPQITQLFVEDSNAISSTVPFVRVAGIAVVGKGLDSTFGGILKAAGDNSWPMYGRFVGQYGLLLPIVYLGANTPLGVLAVLVAIVAESWSSGLLAGYRVVSGAWIEISRSYRPEAATD